MATKSKNLWTITINFIKLHYSFISVVLGVITIIWYFFAFLNDMSKSIASIDATIKAIDKNMVTMRQDISDSNRKAEDNYDKIQLIKLDLIKKRKR